VAAQPGWARRLWGYAWRYPKDVVLALGSSLGGMAVMALVPLITKVIIDDVIGGEQDTGPGGHGAAVVADDVVDDHLGDQRDERHHGHAAEGGAEGEEDVLGVPPGVARQSPCPSPLLAHAVPSVGQKS